MTVQPPGSPGARRLLGVPTSLPRMSEIVIGQLVGGRYRVQELVGQGGLGPVLRAHDEVEDMPVALEVARDSALHPDDLAERLVHAVEQARAVQHPALVRLVDVGEDAGRPYIARAWVDGTELGRRYAAGPPAPAEALAVLEQLAHALDAVHAAGQVHADLGPSSVLVRDTPGGPRAYLTGLGVRRALLAAGVGPTLTLGPETSGLPGTLAPELAAGAPPDSRTDVYALACLSFELLSGTPPFTGPTAAAVLAAHASRPRPRLSTRRPGVPAALDAVLAHGMALDPAMRPASTGALVASLHAAVGPEPGLISDDATLAPGRGGAVADAPAAAPRPARRARPRRRRAVVTAIILLAAAGGGVAGVALAASDDSPSSALDVPLLQPAPRLQEGTSLPLRPASTPGPEARAAVVETLKVFVGGNVSNLDSSWKSSVSPLVVGEGPDGAGRCVRTRQPSAQTSFERSPGIAWLRQRRTAKTLPWALQGLDAGKVDFRGARLASWRGISVAPSGQRTRLRIWLARDGLATPWEILYLDFCPATGRNA